MAAEDTSNAVLAERLLGVQSAIAGLQVTLTTMAGQLTQVPLIARDVQHISEAQATQKAQIDELHNRLEVVEVEMPGLLELRKWVIGGILAALSMMGLSLFKLAVYNPYAAQQDISTLITSIVKAQQTKDDKAK